MRAIHLLALLGLVGVQIALPGASYAAAAVHGCCRMTPCDRETPSARPDCCIAGHAPDQADPGTHDGPAPAPVAALAAMAFGDVAPPPPPPAVEREVEAPDSQAPPLYLQHASLLR